MSPWVPLILLAIIVLVGWYWLRRGYCLFCGEHDCDWCGLGKFWEPPGD